MSGVGSGYFVPAPLCLSELSVHPCWKSGHQCRGLFLGSHLCSLICTAVLALGALRPDSGGSVILPTLFILGVFWLFWVVCISTGTLGSEEEAGILTGNMLNVNSAWPCCCPTVFSLPRHMLVRNRSFLDLGPRLLTRAHTIYAPL